jgi:hypothetical protein
LRRLHQPKSRKKAGTVASTPKGHDALDSYIHKENGRIDRNQNIMIPVRSLKLKGDIERALIAYFVKSDSKIRTFHEDKLR